MTTRLARARHAVKVAERDFNERKRQEWNALSARLRTEVDDAVYELRDAGVSVREIGEQYGSQDRATIYKILNRRPAIVDATDERVVTFTNEHGAVYSVTDGTDTFTFEWDFDYHYALMFLGEFDNEHPLVQELRKENNAYTAQIEAI